MRIPPGARVYLTTAISLAGVALATWSGMQAGSAAAGRGWWTLGGVRKAARVAAHITIEDHDDRPERMVRDPARYFADARQRAE